jgi:hypothetical protein
MKRNFLVLAGSVVFLASSARADLTIGTDPSTYNSMGTFDTCTGCLFAYTPVPAALNGQTLVSWSFYSLTTDPVTPLILAPGAGTTFTVVGIGTTISPTSTGVQTNPFGIVQGSAVLATGDYLGWRDGGLAPPSQTPGGGLGNIALTGDGFGTPDGPGVYYFPANVFNDPNGLSLGETDPYTNAFTATRAYYVDFTATTPEPMYYGVLGIGLVGIMLFRRFARPS